MKKNLGLIIVCSLFGLLFIFFAVLAIGAAFEVKTIVKLEYDIINDWEWTKFNIMTFSLIGLAVSTVVIISSLVISDDKNKRVEVRTRRQSTMFK